MKLPYRVPLPPAITDVAAQDFLVSAEDYVRRVRDAYDWRANMHRLGYRASGITVILAGASLPLLTTLSYPSKSLVIALLGVFVSVVTALRAFYRWDQMWALLRATEYAISRSYWNWRATVGDLLAAPGGGTPEAATAGRKATVRLLDEIAEIRRGEAASFFRDMPFPDRR
jgi:hypothetical protein